MASNAQMDIVLTAQVSQLIEGLNQAAKAAGAFATTTKQGFGSIPAPAKQAGDAVGETFKTFKREQVQEGRLVGFYVRELTDFAGVSRGTQAALGGLTQGIFGVADAMSKLQAGARMAGIFAGAWAGFEVIKAITGWVQEHNQKVLETRLAWNEAGNSVREYAEKAIDYFQRIQLAARGVGQAQLELASKQNTEKTIKLPPALVAEGEKSDTTVPLNEAIVRAGAAETRLRRAIEDFKRAFPQAAEYSDEDLRNYSDAAAVLLDDLQKVQEFKASLDVSGGQNMAAARDKDRRDRVTAEVAAGNDLLKVRTAGLGRLAEAEAAHAAAMRKLEDDVANARGGLYKGSKVYEDRKAAIDQELRDARANAAAAMVAAPPIKIPFQLVPFGEGPGVLLKDAEDAVGTFHIPFDFVPSTVGPGLIEMVQDEEEKLQEYLRQRKASQERLGISKDALGRETQPGLPGMPGTGPEGSPSGLGAVMDIGKGLKKQDVDRMLRVEDQKKAALDIKQSWEAVGGAIGSAFGAIGSAVGGTAGKVISAFAGMIEQAIKFAAAVITGQYAALGPMGWVMGVAAVAAMIAQLAGAVGSFDVGTMNVDRDQVAQIHKGEVILPVGGPAEAYRQVAGGRFIKDFSAGMKIPKFDVGTWSVPNTGLALVHQGEAILPAGRISDTFRQMAQGGGAPSSSQTLNVSINAAALDRSWWDRNQGNILAQISAAARNGRRG